MNLGYSFEMVTTNCETGRCEYLQERNGNNIDSTKLHVLRVVYHTLAKL